MPEQRTFAIQTLIATLVLNAILLGVIYYVPDAQQTTSALMLFGVGLVITLILWATIWFIGRRLIEEAAESAAADARASLPEREPAARPITEPTRAAPPAAPEKPAPPSETAAVQILSILQREGRLIDFLQEDLSAYEDAQIGAAVRNIHEGSKKALLNHVTLEPIFSETEGSQVTVEPGFDVQAVRLSGNVAGDPPFTGTLRHRGWRVIEVELPQPSRNSDGEMILAAAEVEVNG